MKVAPIKNYNGASFPTRRIIDEHPELLKLVPKRWQTNPAVLTALAGLCVMMADCRQSAGAETTSRVAPIFQHGDGRGGFGCRAINPPVLLSEDEAREVVVQEGKRAGVSFQPDAATLPSVAMPLTTRWPFRADLDKNDKYHPRKRTHRLSVKLDGTDPKRHISYEVVTRTDFDAWETKDLSKLRMCSAWGVDIVDAATEFRNGLIKARPKGVYGVFYDPCVGRRDAEKRYDVHLPKYGTPNVDWKAEYAKMDNKAKDLARELLRAQVRDFIKWLKAEGVI